MACGARWCEWRTAQVAVFGLHDSTHFALLFFQSAITSDSLARRSACLWQPISMYKDARRSALHFMNLFYALNARYDRRSAFYTVIPSSLTAALGAFIHVIVLIDNAATGGLSLLISALRLALLPL
eukprot:5937896-Pleurochrysis_carterae.AAC.2